MNNKPDLTILGVRAQRRANNKDTSEYVIKSSLVKSLNKGNSQIIQAIKNNISDRVRETSKGILRLSHSINIMIKDIMSSDKNPLNIVLPEFLTKRDDTFALHLMLGTEKDKTNPYIIIFLQHRNNILIDTPNRLLGDTNTLTAAASQYMTNYRTYIETTFEKKQKSFLYVWCQRHEIQDDCNTIRYLINGWDIKKKYDPDNLFNHAQSIPVE